MLRIRYKKQKGYLVSQLFPITDKLIPQIFISNSGELCIKSADKVIYIELCTNVRNAKYRARKKIEEYGYELATEIRNRNGR